MPTDQEKIKDLLGKILGNQQAGPNFMPFPPDQRLRATMNRGLPAWAQNTIMGGMDTEGPEMAAGAVAKLAKAGGTKARELFDAFKGLPADAPVRKLNDALQQLHETSQRANQAGLWPQVENFIMPLISDAKDIVNSHMRQGKPLRLSNEQAFPGKFATKIEGKATPEQVKETHETVTNAIDALRQMIEARGPVKPPKRTGSVQEFLKDRAVAQAETPKPASASQANPAINAPKLVESGTASGPERLFRVVDGSGKAGFYSAKSPALAVEKAQQTGMEAIKAEEMTHGGAQPAPQGNARVKDPEMYISKLVELSKSPNYRLDERNVAHLKKMLDTITADPSQAIEGEADLLKKVLANQGK